ncbi:MAG: DnaJ domain-containing protein [Clostridia bacterium]
MKYKNYYEILNVNRKTSKEDIKLSYRKLAKKYHPDSNNDINNDSFFKDISEAYETLINEDKKRKYDKQIAKYGFGYTDNTPLTNIRYEIKSGTNVLNDIFSNILRI